MKIFFPNKKKLLKTVLIILFFFSIIIISIKFFEHKKISEKNLEIEKILIWSIEEYKNNTWEYPKNLNQIEENNIINNINILKNKNKINYKKISNKNWDSFVLEILE